LSVWHTPDNDGLGVRFLAVPPDFPPNTKGVEELAEFYLRLLGNSGGKLVEINRWPGPHPLPQALPEDKKILAMYSFSEYGQWAAYASYQETTAARASGRS